MQLETYSARLLEDNQHMTRQIEEFRKVIVDARTQLIKAPSAQEVAAINMGIKL